jgi:hypothetical protein
LPTLPIDNDEWQLFCKWSKIADHPVMKSRIEWPLLKLSSRCFEKLARSYRGQVSRLLDITRFSLWFDRIEDITTALNCIMSDPQVHLLRIKNSMSKGYKPHARHAHKTRFLSGCSLVDLPMPKLTV